MVPLAILEPVKPVGFYLTAKGHLVSGGSVIAIGEIIKVTLVEQVIEITKPKLLSFHWFAWMYSRWEAVLERLNSRAWQAMKRQEGHSCSGRADEVGNGSAITHTLQRGRIGHRPGVARGDRAGGTSYPSSLRSPLCVDIAKTPGLFVVPLFRHAVEEG
jgi:hypothetical protein